MGKFIGGVLAALIGLIIARAVGIPVVERIDATGAVDNWLDNIVAADWPHLLS
jgi:hypothetical protein